MKTGKPHIIAESIRRKIKSGEWTGRVSLPSYRRLAKAYQVSINTIAAAVKLLEQERVITRRKRSGAYVNGREPTAPLPTVAEATKYKSQKIADDIIADITIGNLKIGNPLPPQKTLTYKYHTSYQTVRKALGIVNRKGMIHETGYGFQTGPKPGSGNQLLSGRIHLYVSIKTLENWFRFGFHEEFESLLLEMSQSGNVHVCDTKYEPKTIPTMRRSQHDERACVLYIFDNHRFPRSTPDISKHIETELTFLAQRGYPVVFLGHALLLGRVPAFSFPKFRHLYVLDDQNLAAGRTAAHYLHHLNHTKAAFFNFFEDYWSNERCKGFELGFDSHHAKKGKVFRFHGHFQAQTIRQSRPFHARMERVHRFVREAFNQYEPTDQFQFQRVLADIRPYVYGDCCRRFLKPCFEQALKRKENITAWVCEDHQVTLAAFDYLSEKGIKIPDELSLVSLNDNQDTTVKSITSYNYQRVQKGYIIAHCLLGDIPISRDKKGMVQCPGRMIERGSTRSVK